MTPGATPFPATSLAPGSASAPGFHAARVSPRVWRRLLALREGGAASAALDWSREEAAAFRLYAPVAARGRAMVLAQVGQSLDGRVATVSGDARDISGPDGLAHLHRLRALVEGVVIGVRTALHDAPRLTVRLVPGQSPARVVIDPKGRLGDEACVFAPDGVRRIVVQAVDRARPRGVEVIRLPAHEGWIAPDRIVEALAAAGLRHLMIEGGGITIAQFLEAGQLHRLHVAVAPLIIGAGPQGISTRPVATLAEALRPGAQVYGLGSDVVFDCALA